MKPFLERGAYLLSVQDSSQTFPPQISTSFAKMMKHVPRWQRVQQNDPEEKLRSSEQQVLLSGEQDNEAFLSNTRDLRKRCVWAVLILAATSGSLILLTATLNRQSSGFNSEVKATSFYCQFVWQALVLRLLYQHRYLKRPKFITMMSCSTVLSFLLKTSHGVV